MSETTKTGRAGKGRAAAPPQTPKRKHTSQLNFRLTPEHEELIRAAAEHAGQTLTNWCRGVLVRAARQELGER